MLGTGFAVGPRLKPAIMDFKAINDRLCTLCMGGKFFNISLINVHAPTQEKEEEEKDLFYGRLARTIDACPRHDIIIILGDFHAKVGREPIYLFIYFYFYFINCSVTFCYSNSAY